MKYLTLLDVPRTDGPGGRVYHTPSGDFPSVTTVLGQTADRGWLDAWRDRVGHEKAREISEEAADIGTKMHTALERLLSLRELAAPVDANEAEGHRLARVAMVTNLRPVQRVRAQECVLYSAARRYAGSCDLVCDWGLQSTLGVVDHKNSRWRKTEPGDYALQLAAYAEAHEEMYPEDGPVLVAVVSIAVRFGDPVRFVLKDSALEKARAGWRARLEQHRLLSGGE